MRATRPGVGRIESFDSAQWSGWLVSETGARRPFRIRPDGGWLPRKGQEVVFDRCWNALGLFAFRVAPLRTYEPAPRGAR